MKKILITALCLAGVFLAFMLLSPPSSWDGAARAKVEVDVVDAASGTPLGGVSVSLLNRSQPKTTSTTDEKGRATMSESFPAGGTIRLFYRTTHIYVADHFLHLEKEGFTATTTPLSTESLVDGTHIRCRASLTRIVENTKAIDAIPEH